MKEIELFFLPRLWGIPSVFWHPDLLNSGKPQTLVFPIDKIIFFLSRNKFQLTCALVTEVGSVYTWGNWDHSSHILTELHLDHKLHTPDDIFQSLFLCFLSHHSKLLSLFLGHFMVTPRAWWSGCWDSAKSYRRGGDLIIMSLHQSCASCI